jgi:ribosomal protein S18 acetylase RimI-like enzyme
MRESATLSELDSRRFGKRIYRALIEEPLEVASLEALASREAVDLFIVRCPGDFLPTVHALERAGHELMDTLVYYGASTAAFAAAAMAPWVREATKDDAPALQRIALDAFTDYGGHYHADERLDPSLATLGYVEWCLSSVDNPRFTVWVAEQDARIAGFLAVRHDVAQSEITLNGVAREFQRRGVYDALFKTCGRSLSDRGVPQIEVSTQITNIAPQKVWARAGLTIRRAYYTFHKWYER